MHLREVELDKAGDPSGPPVVDKLERMQRAKWLAGCENFSRDTEEIGCRLPLLLHNVHGRHPRGEGRAALSRNRDIHVVFRWGTPSTTYDRGFLWVDCKPVFRVDFHLYHHRLKGTGL